MSDLPLTKQALRELCKAARAALTSEEVHHAAEQVSQHCLEHLPQTASVIAGYCSVRSELNMQPLYTQLAAKGYQLALPVIANEAAPLVFRQWQIDSVLQSGQHDIPVPAADEPVVVPDVIIVPVVGFDDKGHRLGQGGGYYDRTIAQLRADHTKDVLCIGVAYAVQQVEAIPNELHDALLDMMITEHGVIHTV